MVEYPVPNAHVYLREVIYGQVATVLFCLHAHPGKTQ